MNIKRSVRSALGQGPIALGGDSRGFTLIELMIVVAIIAIIAAIAYPSYIHYITKTKRAAAEGCLSEYANYMERYYTTNLKYTGATLPALDCASTQKTGQDYSYALSNLAQSTYTITASVKAGSSQANRDTQCKSLTLDQTGAQGASPGTVSDCW